MSGDGELRFVKKIPPSGGGPGGSFKLSLPYSFVASHLQHFIGRTFELASSSDSPQSWQGRISPRRNKDRNEFILQGWKLFAEAHNVQAGDQVSFEVTSPQRMVVKILQPVSVSAHPSLSADVPATENPAKAMKSGDSWSPRRSARKSQQLASPIDGSSNVLPTLSSGSPLSPSNTFRDAAVSRMAQPVQSWMSPSCKRPSLENLLSSPDPPKEKMLDQLVPPSSGTNLPEIWTSPRASAASAALDVYIPGIFDNLESCAAGFPVEHTPPLRHDRKAANLDDPSPLLSSFEAMEEQSRSESEFRALVARMQEELNASARSALQAAMRMETSVMDLPASARPRNNLQASMFSHLSVLKASLWQILVIGNEIHSPSTSTDTQFADHI